MQNEPGTIPLERERRLVLTILEEAVRSYQRYVVKNGSHSPNTGSLDGQVAMEHCRAGDTSGIPVLEQKLRGAGVELPVRG